MFLLIDKPLNRFGKYKISIVSFKLLLYRRYSVFRFIVPIDYIGYLKINFSSD